MLAVSFNIHQLTAIAHAAVFSTRPDPINEDAAL